MGRISNRVGILLPVERFLAVEFKRSISSRQDGTLRVSTLHILRSSRISTQLVIVILMLIVCSKNNNFHLS